MKKLALIFLLTATLWSCSSNEGYDELPAPIVTFITKYWPNPVIETYSHPSADEYVVDIKDGPKLEFDENYSWTDVDGVGMPLPQVFLFDQLPGALYEYLEAGSYTNQVFEVERNARTYELELLNIDLTYDIATGKITQN